MTFLRRFACPFIVAVLALTLLATPKFAFGDSGPASTPSTLASASPSPVQPPQPAYQLAPDKLAKAIALSRIRNILDITGSIWSLLFIWILLATRAWSGIEAWMQRLTARRWLQGLYFFAAYFLLTFLSGLPLDIYAEHASHTFGISVQGWTSWFSEQGKALCLALIVGSFVMLLFNWIVRRWPRRYWLGLWLVTIPIMLVIMLVEPIVIEPLFDKFQPLSQSNPALVAELEKVVSRTGTSIPPDHIFLMQASTKTNGLNAYVSGIGATKRIVVWDTTAGRIPDDEVLFIFGHESGHYVLRHIPKMLAILTIALFFIYWFCAAAAEATVRRFGSRWGITDPASRTSFVVLLFIISIVGFVLQPASNAISRHFEHQADIFGQEAVHNIVADPQKTAVSAFNHLGEAWLEDPSPSPLIEFWLYNHPSEQDRATFASQYDPWANGGHGQFFDK